MRRNAVLAPILALALVLPAAVAAEESWVERSDRNARILLDLQAKYGPEMAGFLGVEGLDEEVFQLPADLNDRSVADIESALVGLRARLAKETDPAVRQDLEILIRAADDSIRGTRLSERLELPYFNLPQTIFQGIRSLLDPQVAEERRPAALVRLRKYAGLVDGFEPITEQAEAFLRAAAKDPELIGPFRDDLEKDLANMPRFVAGVAQLFEANGVEGWQEPFNVLGHQLEAWEAFLREELMPRTRTDFRLPEELYRFNLEQSGIDMPVGELVSRAKVSFREIQNEMQAIAQLVAAERGYGSADYRDVIRELKKNQIVGDAILPHYRQRIAELETIIEREGIVTLPEREMRIRIASEAEAAQIPAPNMRPPRLIGNTGEMGEFVLPLRVPSADGSEISGFDDFTFDAASWTLTAHEGRPGHELQFASIVEKGVPIARALYAFNSVNVEGWALYAEAEMKPYLPLDGQLIALQHRLLRAARAYLDPGLQLGEIDRDTARRVLEQEVVLSPAMANQEVERYTFWAPGQAPSYFCGYSRLMELRTDVERMLGDRFDRKAFHDFLLAQGLVPPALQRQAVMDDFVAPRLAAAASD